MEQDFPSLKKLQARLRTGVSAMYEILTESCSKDWLPKTWDCYEAAKPLPNDASVSKWVALLLPQLSRLSQEAPSDRRRSLLHHIALKLLAQLSAAIQSDSIQFGAGGAEHLLLDVHFLMKVWTSITDEQLQKASLDLCTLALHASPSPPTKDTRWYDARVELALGNLKKLVDFKL